MQSYKCIDLFFINFVKHYIIKQIIFFNEKLTLDEFFVLCICNNMLDYDLRLTNIKYTNILFTLKHKQTLFTNMEYIQVLYLMNLSLYLQLF